MAENKQETVAERLERMRAEKEAAKAQGKVDDQKDLVSQITHESDGTPDYEAIADFMEARHSEQAKGENYKHVKETIYIREDLSRAFNALCVEHGDKKRYVNQAIADFIAKKYRELNEQ